MPIKNTPSEEIPFLSNYQPYNLEGRTLAENIYEMFSYTIVPSDIPVDLLYHFGSGNEPIAMTLALKNITTNAQLSVEILYDGQYFAAVTGTRSDINSQGRFVSAILLDAGQTKLVKLVVDKDKMDPMYQNILSNCEIRVTFLPIGDLVFRDVSATSLPIQVLPNQISFYD